MASAVFVATSGPPGWDLGRWAQKSATCWEEQKVQAPSESYLFDIVDGPSAPGSSTIRLRMKGTTTEALLLNGTVQIFVDGQYLGEYCGGWAHEDARGGSTSPPPLPVARDVSPGQRHGRSPMAQKSAPPPWAAGGQGSPMAHGSPMGQKSAPPPPQYAAGGQGSPLSHGSPMAQKSAPPPPQYASGGHGSPMAQGSPMSQKSAPPPPAGQDFAQPQAASPAMGYGQRSAPPPPPHQTQMQAPAPGQKSAPQHMQAQRGAPPQAAPAGHAGARGPPPLTSPTTLAPPPQKASDLDSSPKTVTKLLQATLSGDASAVARILEAKADPDVVGMDGTSPLLAAASNGNVKVVEALLAAGADVNLGKDGNTPMTVAFQRGNKEILRALFSAAFQTLESAVGPGRTGSPGGRAYRMGGSGADDEVPESALYELREVTAKLAELGKTKGGSAAPYDFEGMPPAPVAGDGERMREEAIREAMVTIARATD
eukprot:CAMPEP_0175232620 /NCGR_PEP_ID=MMETSP0093-20121207/26055_1 /TAXON_ID=311494 /ORGANISM="Alexandrium monilatum, Strain CCMP3105" /LENGTH=482 /DNA_ID=CAMNT_0016526487 /DNA_START=51 /DNA_END=1499 /DNA_ORIENTATION=+